MELTAIAFYLMATIMCLSGVMVITQRNPRSLGFVSDPHFFQCGWAICPVGC